jgi:propanol-preferring alcohol dehydrogenase
MNVVRYLGAERNFELVTVPLPTFATAGQVLIEVKAASLCHTELHFADGTLNLGVNDITMGHECAGIIVSVGDGVPTERVGQRVIVYYYAGCGKCKQCVDGNEQLCGSLAAQYGFTSDGGLARFITVYSRNAVLLPAAISFTAAAPIACSVTTISERRMGCNLWCKWGWAEHHTACKAFRSESNRYLSIWCEALEGSNARC